MSIMGEKLLENLFEIYEICQDLEAHCNDPEDEASDAVYPLVLDVSDKVLYLIQWASQAAVIQDTQESLLKEALHNAAVAQWMGAEGMAPKKELGLPPPWPWPRRSPLKGRIPS